MSSPLPDLDHLRDILPLRMGLVELDILLDQPTEVPHPGSDEVWATVRVIHYEADTGWVRDILQQDVRLAPHPNLLKDAERVRACLEAHGEVLTEVFARPRDPYAHDFPADLLFLDDLLTLRTVSTREQFATALRARKRLGKRLA